MKDLKKGKIEINDDAEWTFVCSTSKKSLEQHLKYIKESVKSYEDIRDSKKERLDWNDELTLRTFD